MDFWDLLSYSAWTLSVILIVWMVMDTLRVNREYDEDLLISSREGLDELLDADAGAEGSS